MKKLFAVMLVAFAALSPLFAGQSEDTKFNQYFERIRRSADGKTYTVIADKTFRIIYSAKRISATSARLTPQLIELMKANLLKTLKARPEDCRIIKELRITVILTSITEDDDAVCIKLSHLDI